MHETIFMSITIQNISKLYGKQKALDGISFSINRGEIVGFLGPNGAGKSTTMKILNGFVNASEGEVFINNLNINLNNSYSKVEIQIYTMVGQLIKTINKTNSVQMRINLSELSSGSYILKINADGKNKSMLIIKE